MHRQARQAVKIEITWDDGTRSGAEGDHAAEVMRWWNECEIFTSIHGMKFTGRPLRKVEGDGEMEGSDI